MYTNLTLKGACFERSHATNILVGLFKPSTCEIGSKSSSCDRLIEERGFNEYAKRDFTSLVAGVNKWMHRTVVLLKRHGNRIRRPISSKPHY